MMDALSLERDDDGVHIVDFHLKRLIGLTPPSVTVRPFFPPLFLLISQSSLTTGPRFVFP
jgi:hypothetical protein